jgi:hypothetical protein
MLFRVTPTRAQAGGPGYYWFPGVQETINKAVRRMQVPAKISFVLIVVGSLL